ncbi:MAG TPA: N,N-dimethylformamidase beta subunit family domain-containing protein, partial [Prosthecobacter sp.]
MLRLVLLFLFVVSSLASLVRAAEPPSLHIEGYAGQRSVAQGEEVTLHVSTTGAKYDLEVARLGAERVVVWKKAGVPGQAYPVPEDASAMGCRWPESVRVPVGADWKSGYYEVALRAADNGGKWTQRGRRTVESTAWFIVRQAKPGST